MLFCVVGTSGMRRLDDVGLQSPIRESLAAAPFPRINTCPPRKRIGTDPKFSAIFM